MDAIASAQVIPQVIFLRGVSLYRLCSVLAMMVS